MNALLLLAALAFSAEKIELSTGSAIVDLPQGRFLIKGPAEVKLSKGEIRVWEGGLLSALKWPMRIRTGKLAAAVRGPAELYVNGDYVCVCKGSAELSEPMKKTVVPHQVNAAGHTGTRLVAGKWQAVENILGHTDAELALLGAPPPKADKKDEKKPPKK